jgi:hypothetical protein
MMAGFRLLFIILGLTIAGVIMGATPEEIASLTPIERERVNVSRLAKTTMALPMEFAQADFFQYMNEDWLRRQKVKRVQLVYTKYRQSEKFNQYILNLERLEKLKIIWPELFSDKAIIWQLIMQTGATDDETAKTYFHGFIITFEKDLAEEKAKTERLTFDDWLNKVQLGRDSVYEEVSYRKRSKRVPTGYYLPTSERKQKQGIRYDKPGKDRIREYELKVDSTRTVTTKKTFIPDKSSISKLSALPDTSVIAILKRNDQWPERLHFVVDVTGSMSPFTIQILLWFKIHFEKGTGFTFFNDGDRKSDSQKPMGKAGGIYKLFANTPEEVQQKAKQAMMAGDGGDARENDVEALIAAQKFDPTADALVLIADNSAGARDISLIGQVNKPVFVILCGPQTFIHPDYLAIAKHTGGSLHTLKKDFTDFDNIKENQQVVFAGNRYTYSKGRFIPIK